MWQHLPPVPMMLKPQKVPQMALFTQSGVSQSGTAWGGGRVRSHLCSAWGAPAGCWVLGVVGEQRW